MSSFYPQKRKRKLYSIATHLKETDLKKAMRRKVIHLIIPDSKTYFFDCLCNQVVKCVWEYYSNFVLYSSRV